MKYLLILFLASCAPIGHMHYASDYEIDKAGVEYFVYEVAREKLKLFPYQCKSGLGRWLPWYSQNDYDEKAENIKNAPPELNMRIEDWCKPMPSLVSVSCTNRFKRNFWGCHLIHDDGYDWTYIYENRKQ